MSSEGQVERKQTNRQVRVGREDRQERNQKTDKQRKRKQRTDRERQAKGKVEEGQRQERLGQDYEKTKKARIFSSIRE